MTIQLFGDIVSDEWVWVYELFGIACCSPRAIRDAIRDLPADETLIVEINSPGGDAWAGFEMYGLLQSLGERTEAHILVKACSAATTVMCGCARVLASPVAQLMIHQPSVFIYDESVNNEAASQILNFLDSVKASILNSYVVKCAGKTSRRTLEKLVDNSTWMPAQDAIQIGLVDGFLDNGSDAAELIGTSGGVIGVTNSAGGSAVKSLLTRYEDAVRAGLMDEVPGHPVKRNAPQDEKTGPVEEIPANVAPAEDPIITENREIVENLITDWRLSAAIAIERERSPV